jgi:eukaryotic-like serine/threonine-protein kinase
MGDVLRARYKILGVLGHGGMGTVFEAFDEYRLDLPMSSQRLAIKVLHTAVTEREELLCELQREFQNLQLLSHPNIVRVHEFDRDGDLAFLTMELLRGSLLSRVLNARNAIALPRPYALAVIRDVGAALSYAHSRGVIHGDVNPQNIFITGDGELRVLDFGASHKLHRDMRNLDNELSPRSPVATPGYASCQVLEGQQPDARDDLFAFACAAYLLLSGQHPFPKRTAIDARAQRVRPRRPPGLTGQQWRVLQEGLRWERERRPSDVQKWLERFNLAGAAPHLPPLSVLGNTEPPRRGRPLVKATLILGLLLLALGGYGIATNYDSLLQTVMGWSALAKLAASNTGALPDAPVAAPQTPPLAADDTTSTARATPTPSPAPAASPTAPAASTPAPAARRVAPTATAPLEASSRAAKAWPAHIELATDTVEVEPGETSAWITVRRKGDPRGVASFTWWTESGTAKPVVDFSPVPPRAENIGSGKYNVTLNIAVSAKPRSRPKSFYVVIDQTESGSPLGARTLTMVTLLPSQ